MDASKFRSEGLDVDAASPGQPSELASTGIGADRLEPKDYVATEKMTIRELREQVDIIQSEIDGLAMRLSKIGATGMRLGKSGVAWSDHSAHAQLGAYPWAKLAGAFAATFVATRLLRRLPLGGIASIAVPLLLRQVTGDDTGRRRR